MSGELSSAVASPAPAVVVEHHIGADQCPPGTPAGRRIGIGIRAINIPSGQSVQFNVSSSRKLMFRCMNVPSLQGVNFVFISIKIADVENVTSANGTTQNGTQTDVGLPGDTFAPWGLCTSIMEGQCLDPAVPAVFIARNTSNVNATLSLALSGETV